MARVSPTTSRKSNLPRGRGYLLVALCLAFQMIASSSAAQQEPAPPPAVAPEPQLPAAAEELIAKFAYAADALDEIEEVQAAVAHALDTRGEAATRAAELDKLRARLRERATILEEFAAEADLGAEEQLGRVVRLALARVHRDRVHAELEVVGATTVRLDEESALLGDLLTVLEQARAEQDATAAEQQELQRDLAAQEEAALEAAEEARRREQATTDETLKQLFARESALREELARVAAERRQQSEAQATSAKAAEEAAAAQADILSRVEALAENPTDAQRREEVDPILRQILTERRAIWARLGEARGRAAAAAANVEQLEAAVSSATTDLQTEQARERELGGGPLWRQRVAVATTELELGRARLRAAQGTRTAAVAEVKRLEEGVEFYSRELRATIDRASPDGRRLVYGLLNDEAWSDAFHRLRDRLHAGRRLWSERTTAIQSVGDGWLQIGLWLGGLAGRVLLAMILMLGLRVVPAVTRRVLDFLIVRRFFRRRPSLAVKLFELLRTVARPILVYIGARYVLAYVVGTFGEFVALRWAIDAMLVYVVGVRVARTMALPRAYREETGLAATGTEYDLRADEAAIADVLHLDLERGIKFVRSARIILLVLTFWWFLPEAVRAITGVSVLSGLITTVTGGAIAVVVYWTLSTWRNELSSLFTRVAGNRLSNATAFVERNKDRFWGVLVVAVASVVVLGWEIARILRRLVRETDWFKRASAYAFQTKIELQQREAMTDDELRAMLPDDLELAFDRATPVLGTPLLVERASMKELRTTLEGMAEAGCGAICIVGDPGVGKSTTLQWLLEGGEFVELDPAPRIHTLDGLFAMFSKALQVEVHSIEDIEVALNDRPATLFVLDGLQRTYLRDVHGYVAYRALMDVLHAVRRRHLFVITSTRLAWEFLTRVYDQRHVFGHIVTLPRWTDDELRQLVERRMAGLPYSTSFSELADLHAVEGGDWREVVKTARGYYRYLAEFSRGLPATAMYFWLQSLTGGEAGAYSVRLFSRPSGAALIAAPTSYRFVLAAIAQHGVLTPGEVARVSNSRLGMCELAATYYAEAGVLQGDTDLGYELAASAMSVTMRHLEDANLI